jgi:hypothetical protein
VARDERLAGERIRVEGSEEQGGLGARTFGWGRRMRTRGGQLLASALTLAIANCQPAVLLVEEAKRITTEFRSAGFVPPPRSIDDITTILDQQKPDPEDWMRDADHHANIDQNRRRNQQGVERLAPPRSAAAKPANKIQMAKPVAGLVQPLFDLASIPARPMMNNARGIGETWAPEEVGLPYRVHGWTTPGAN